jgi:hypothetical protein
MCSYFQSEIVIENQNVNFPLVSEYWVKKHENEYNDNQINHLYV